MQTLWSRTCSCKCSFCLSTSSTALARQASSATARRIFRATGPTSTFLYTTIFAAAVVADGKAKQQRREQWNSAINAARDGTEHTIPDQRLGELGGKAPEGTGLDGGSAIQAGDLEEQVQDLWELITKPTNGSRAVAGYPDLPFPSNSSLTPLVRHHLPPQSLWSYDSMRDQSKRRRYGWKKTRIMELSFAELVHQVMLNAKMHDMADSSLDSLPHAIRNIAALSERELKRARKGASDCVNLLRNVPLENLDHHVLDKLKRWATFAMPNYRQDKDGAFLDVSEALNDALRTLFQQGAKATGEARTTLIAKMCHNLLVSPAPPNINTYNILLTGLGRWDRPDLIDPVFRSLMETKVRPNELTCASVLNHCVQTGNAEGFTQFVALMRGLNDGLMLANPRIKITKAGERRLFRKEGNPDKIVQKVYPTPMVFNQLMAGLLKFAGIQRAWEIYREMLGDGWGLDLRGLDMILRDCLHHKNWHHGCQVWEEMQELRQRDPGMRIGGLVYARMLSLCDVTGHPAAMKEILAEAITDGHGRQWIMRHYLRYSEGLPAAVPEAESDAARDLGEDMATSVASSVREYVLTTTKAPSGGPGLAIPSSAHDDGPFG